MDPAAMVCVRSYPLFFEPAFLKLCCIRPWFQLVLHSISRRGKPVSSGKHKQGRVTDFPLQPVLKASYSKVRLLVNLEVPLCCHD